LSKKDGPGADGLQSFLRRENGYDEITSKEALDEYD